MSSYPQNFQTKEFHGNNYKILRKALPPDPPESVASPNLQKLPYRTRFTCRFGAEKEMLSDEEYQQLALTLSQIFTENNISTKSKH